MKPVLLCIMDGVGIRENEEGNAFSRAFKPNFDKIFSTYPHLLIEASGPPVGLPIDQMGNSEVGHLNIGAGRIVYQPLEFITHKEEAGLFNTNEEFNEVFHHIKDNDSKLHICGLLSNGGIHSHISHLFSLLDLCKKKDVKEVYLHLFTDGRDTLTNAAPVFFGQLEEKIRELNLGSIATISGRYYAMDRDNRWDRVELSYKAMTKGQGAHSSTYQEVLNDSYDMDITDEFIVPTILNEDGLIKENDGIIVFNYRPDRLRELFTALTNPNFKEFPRENLNNLKLVTMMPVSETVISKSAFHLDHLENTLGEYISKKGMRQLRIAETEKYAHVTYFFDGGEETELPNCDRILIPSPKVATYDLSPAMSTVEITDILIEKLDNQYELIVLNFASGDMLGHTGNMDATIKAIEIMDECLGKLYNKIKELDATLIITADHGNCELMLNEKGEKVTSHTTSLVPFILCRKEYHLRNKGKLGDIAPTILDIMQIEIPAEMTGESLLEKDREL